MRLKEDTTSWKANGLQRKLKTIPDEPVHRAKKNRSYWCKGKVGGRHHAYEYQQRPWVLGLQYFRNECTKCGRHGPYKRYNRILPIVK